MFSFKQYLSKTSTILLIIFFPITLYFLLGTVLLLIPTLLSFLAAFLGKFSKCDVLEDFEAEQVHAYSPIFTLFFPITLPLSIIVYSIQILISIPPVVIRLLFIILRFIWKLICNLISMLWHAIFVPIWKSITSLFDFF